MTTQDGLYQGISDSDVLSLPWGWIGLGLLVLAIWLGIRWVANSLQVKP